MPSSTRSVRLWSRYRASAGADGSPAGSVKPTEDVRCPSAASGWLTGSMGTKKTRSKARVATT